MQPVKINYRESIISIKLCVVFFKVSLFRQLKWQVTITNQQNRNDRKFFVGYNQWILGIFQLLMNNQGQFSVDG